MSILWVTSFGRDMYEATGRELVDSFVRSKCDGCLVCYTEGMAGTAFPTQVEVVPIDDDPWLRDWLTANRHLIPRHLGGKAGRCSCPHPDDPRAKDHKPRCVGQWFNRNASRWFRKIVAMRRAAFSAPAGTEAMVWLDSDVAFRRPTSASAVAEWFGRADVFYHKSPKRKAIESGIIGFRLPSGLPYLAAVCAMYESGAFRSESRWDDGYLFTVVRQRMAKAGKASPVSFVDLAKTASGHADVVLHSPVGRYLEHRKGHHGRGLGIMT